MKLTKTHEETVEFFEDEENDILYRFMVDVWEFFDHASFCWETVTNKHEISILQDMKEKS